MSDFDMTMKALILEECLPSPVPVPLPTPNPIHLNPCMGIFI